VLERNVKIGPTQNADNGKWVEVSGKTFPTIKPSTGASDYQSGGSDAEDVKRPWRGGGGRVERGTLAQMSDRRRGY